MNVAYKIAVLRANNQEVRLKFLERVKGVYDLGFKVEGLGNRVNWGCVSLLIDFVCGGVSGLL